MGNLSNITKQIDSGGKCCYIESDGELIAKVYSGKNKGVLYFHQAAQTDPHTQEVINEILYTE